MELINRAYVLAGIVARNLEQVSGSEGIDGLFWLNQLLAEKAVTTKYIPYYTHSTMPTVVGQEIYMVNGLAELEVLSFNLGNVRYSMERDSRKRYFGDPRVDGITSLPFHYYSERVNGGTKIYLYFVPNAVYTLNITGRFALSSVLNDDDLDDVIDNFYQLFLMFELADYLAMWNKITLPPQTQMKLQEYRDIFEDLNPVDLTTNKISTLSSSDSLSWAQINIGRGWTMP